MDFSLLDSSIFHHKIDMFPQLSPDFEFSGESPTSFTAAPPPFHNNAFTISLSEDPHTPKPPFFLQNNSSFTSLSSSLQMKRDSVTAMREMIFRMAMMQPIHVSEPEQVTPAKRKNVKISKDPQSVAARRRRERISHRMKILGRMVPGGTKLDTASMLDEVVHYLKFLKKQVETLELQSVHNNNNNNNNRPIMGHVVGSTHMFI